MELLSTRLGPEGPVFRKPCNSSGLESCIVIAVFTFKIKALRILKIIQWNYQLKSQNWLVFIVS